MALELRNGVWQPVPDLPAKVEERDNTLTWDQLAELLQFGGLQYPFLPRQTMLGERQEWPDPTFEGYVRTVYHSSGPIFALMAVRMLLFSEARFLWQGLVNGRPGELFYTPDLDVLDEPWPGATTGDLLARMIQDADIGGNALFTRRGDPPRIVRMRPDWTTIIVGFPGPVANPTVGDLERSGWDLDAQLLGYMYQPGGPGAGLEPEVLLPEEVCHFAPLPDPIFRFRGVSWVTPVLREIMADSGASTHKLKFFENGAPQPLDAKILTPVGWSTMGEMHVGSCVVGADGKAHMVTAVYPQGEQDVYRVLFADGTAAECTLDHIWTVSNNYDRQCGLTRNMTLDELMADGFHYDSGPAKWAVPLPDPVEYQDQGPLPIDPYLLGLLLGDGSFRGNGRGSGGVSLSCHAHDTDETPATVDAALPAGVVASTRDEGGWSASYFRAVNRRVARDSRGRIAWHEANPLTARVRELGLWDVGGRDKFVPESYLRASIEDRIAVLQGLIDSDGHVGPTTLRFTTTSFRLAEGVVDLVGSLGGVATISPCKGRATLTVSIQRLPEWIVPVRLRRKVAAYRPTSALRVRTMVGATLVRRAQVQCIAVDSEDHLYITDGFVVTHNTSNMVITLEGMEQIDAFDAWVEKFKKTHEGVMNAYKTLFLASAKADVVGSSFRDMDFKRVQGAGETRLAAAAGIPPVIVGFSEGLEASTYANYALARRRVADGTFRPLWRNAAGSMARIIPRPKRRGRVRLWYDDRDIPFLREDREAVAKVQQSQASAVSTYVLAGFEPDTVVQAVNQDNMSLLKHTGLTSVQLLPPGVAPPPEGSLAPAPPNGQPKPAAPTGV